MGFIGAGLSLAPWNFTTSKPSIQTLTLPKATIHIPHGNFAAAAIDSRYIPELDVEISVQRFMRNGIVASQQDVSVYTFTRQEETLNLCYRDGEWHTSGEISGVKWQPNDHQMILSNAKFELLLEDGGSYLAASVNK